MKDFLLEVGVEEFPANVIENSLKQLGERFVANLELQRINYSDLQLFSTPRRLAIKAKLAENQEDLNEEIKGPPKSIAYQDGEWTKAGLGFARSQNVDPKDLYLKDFNGAEYVYASRYIKGKSTSEVLAKVLPEIILGLSFPNSMRWGSYDIKFARPIAWLVALFDNQVVPFSIGRINSGNKTFGHRQLCEKPVEIADLNLYENYLKEAYVIVDSSKRKELIRQQVISKAKEVGGQVLLDEDLLNEVNNLVEYPTAFAGKFASEFLDLPQEVIITPMKEHQRYFPVVDHNNNLLPVFIGVRNGADNHLDLVAEGNERVLSARLADAKFFYQEDIKDSLETKVQKLKDVVFQDGLGTLYDKTMRLINLATEFSDLLGIEVDRQLIERAALLAKADLVTQMVFEFPELQGIMGSKYALVSGEDMLVARAIEEHYKPRFAGDSIPETELGILISLVDKIDTLVGYFSLDIIPTGSQDPFALRRQALGVVQMLRSGAPNCSLKQLFEKSLAAYGSEFQAKNDTLNKLLDFIKQRVRGLMRDEGYQYDLIDAVLALEVYEVGDLFKRVVDLSAFRKYSEFENLHVAFERAANIVSKAGFTNKFEQARFTEADQTFYNHVVACEEKVNNHLKSGDYASLLQALADLRKPLDDFFDAEMIMHEDEVVRANRLSLLSKTVSLFDSFADFRKIVIT